MRHFWMISASTVLTCVALVVATLVIFQFSDATPAQAQSVSRCDSYAHDYARRRTRGNVTSSAVRNTLVGAGIGSLIDGRGGARSWAGLGLGAGLLGGGIAAYNDYETHFNRAFRRCMRI
jgi:hypothetical protein